jgi:hypothetical protein
MGVADALWWSVWWKWMVVWAVTVGLLIGAVIVLVNGWRDRPVYRHRAVRTVLYLSQKAVSDFRVVDPGGPAAEITAIMAALAAADDLVHVDLRTRHIGTGGQGSAALGDRLGRDPAQRRLRDLDGFMLVRGSFRRVDETPTVITLAAPYGDPPELGEAPMVLIDCPRDELHRDLPDGAFVAYCLAKPRDWNRRERRLVLDPIALFH